MYWRINSIDTLLKIWSLRIWAVYKSLSSGLGLTKSCTSKSDLSFIWLTNEYNGEQQFNFLIINDNQSCVLLRWKRQLLDSFVDKTLLTQGDVNSLIDTRTIRMTQYSQMFWPTHNHLFYPESNHRGPPHQSRMWNCLCLKSCGQKAANMILLEFLGPSFSFD